MPHSLHALPDIVAAVSGLSGQSLCDVFVQQLRQHLGADAVLLTTLDQTNTLLYVQASDGANRETDTLWLGASAFARALRQSVLVIDRSQADFPERELLAQGSSDTLICSTLYNQQQHAIGLCIVVYQQPLVKDHQGPHLLTLLSSFIAKELTQQGRTTSPQPKQNNCQMHEYWLRESLRIGLMGTWSVDFPSRQLNWSEATYRLFDLPPFSRQLCLPDLEQYIVPCDRAKVMLELERVMEGVVSEPHVFEYRIISAKGVMKWLRAQVSSVREPGKGLLQLQGITQDTTQSKQVGNQVLDRYFELMINHLPAAMVQLGLTGRVEKVNNAALQLLGYRPDECDQLSLDDIFAEPSNKALSESCQDVVTGLVEKLVWRRALVTKLGQVVHCDVTMIGLRNSSGEVACYLAVFEPISNSQLVIEHIDSLTSLPSRAGFMAELEHRIACQHEFSVFQINLDKFKSINYTQKLATGDALLTLVAERLKGRLRQRDYLARLGSDEFAIIVPDALSVRQAQVFAEQLQSAFAQGFQLAQQQLYITASIGCVIYPDHGFSHDELMQRVGLALSEAKNQGRNTYVVYEQAMRQSELEKQAMLVALTEAIKANHLTVFYQPIIDNKTGRVVKLEALVRWYHPDKGFISPMVFVPLAEEAGLIQQLGQQVLAQACFQTKQLQQLGYTGMEVCINRSTLEFQSVDINATEWLTVIEKSGLATQSVTLEITESLLMNSDTQHMKRIRALKAAGVKIAIDDFGTGYSSLNYLRSLPADVVKIDRSFISDIPRNQQDNLLFNGIINIVHNLGMQVVVEGVETSLQQTYVQQQGCDYSQGFLMSKPLSFEQIKEYLQQQYQPDLSELF
ncbi:bifunctional diguanylate cyclase/phosphodiesterase [Motilimonas eburnea]|uniref:bifunctional diguanylate cyclase/phosphodiesterase n=1 Tax=Motilimonas eburnea TaxID=1737488 RepID=UPI001E2F410C|nr:EAL domain-containing protein [Motilimonas eburnea]MCE2572881.1 EAL domain-containing protein [Motilimonas eburnea]